MSKINNTAFGNVDSRLKNNKDELIAFAKTQGYDYYSEYVYKSLQRKTAQALHDEIVEGIGTASSIMCLWNVKKRVKAEIEKVKRGKSRVKKQDTCKTDDCKNKIPEENHSFCTSCHSKHKEISSGIDMSFYESHNCEYI